MGFSDSHQSCYGVLASTQNKHEGNAPEGEGVASTGSRPRTIAHWRAVARPSSFQESVLLLMWGTTRVRMGIGGLYLLTRFAVVPAPAHCVVHCNKQRIFEQTHGSCPSCGGMGVLLARYGCIWTWNQALH